MLPKKKLLLMLVVAPAMLILTAIKLLAAFLVVTPCAVAVGHRHRARLHISIIYVMQRTWLGRSSSLVFSTDRY